MRPILMGAVALAFLAVACSPLDRADFDSDAAFEAAVAERQARLERAGRISESIRMTYATQVEAYRAAGIDIKVLSPREKMLAATACGTLTSISTVVAPDAARLSDEGLAWCAELVKLLGEAAPAPVTAPAPVPAPPPPAVPAD